MLSKTGSNEIINKAFIKTFQMLKASLYKNFLNTIKKKQQQKLYFLNLEIYHKNKTLPLIFFLSGSNGLGLDTLGLDSG